MISLLIIAFMVILIGIGMTLKNEFVITTNFKDYEFQWLQNCLKSMLLECYSTYKVYRYSSYISFVDLEY